MAALPLILASCLREPAAPPSTLRIRVVGDTAFGRWQVGQLVGPELPAVTVVNAAGFPEPNVRIRFIRPTGEIPADSFTNEVGNARVSEWVVGPGLGRDSVRAYTDPPADPPSVLFVAEVVPSNRATITLVPDTLRMAVGDSVRVRTDVIEFFGSIGTQSYEADSLRVLGPPAASLASDNHVRGIAEGRSVVRIFIPGRVLETVAVVGDATFEPSTATLPTTATAVAIRAGGGIIAAEGGSAGTLVAIDPSSRVGTTLASYAGDVITDIAVAPSDTVAVYGSTTGARVFDPRTGASIRELPTGGEVRRVAFTATGDIVLVGAGIWRYTFATDTLSSFPVVPSNRDLLAVHPTTAIAFTSGANPGSLLRLNLTTGAVTVTRNGVNELSSLALSPDGTRLYAGSRFIPVRAFDAATLADAGDAPAGTFGTAVALSPDGELLAAASSVSGNLVILDTQTLLPLHRLRLDDVRRMQWSSDARTLLAASVSRGLVFFQ